MGPGGLPGPSAGGAASAGAAASAPALPPSPPRPPVLPPAAPPVSVGPTPPVAPPVEVMRPPVPTPPVLAGPAPPVSEPSLPPVSPPAPEGRAPPPLQASGAKRPTMTTAHIRLDMASQSRPSCGRTESAGRPGLRPPFDGRGAASHVAAEAEVDLPGHPLEAAGPLGIEGAVHDPVPGAGAEVAVDPVVDLEPDEDPIAVAEVVGGELHPL